MGVEIVGEIMHYFPEKQVNLIYSGKKMVERNSGAHKHIKKYFKSSRNVHIFKQQKVVDVYEDGVVTDQVGFRSYSIVN